MEDAFPGTPQPEITGGGGIEMVAVPAASYTSLRDIMPHPNNDSWNEIPIKNPLLKQAALAYLQPMSTPPEVGSKGLLEKLKEKCLCGGAAAGTQFGCFRWLHMNEFMAGFVGFFCERMRLRNEDRRNEEEEEDEDEDENVVVD